MKYLTIFCFLFFISINSFAQKAKAPAEKFIVFLNNYQADSLEVLLADSFKLTRTFTTYSNNRASFFDFYIPYSKECNGKFKILEKTSGKNSTQFLVKDESDYFKYLGIDGATWKISVSVKNNKVESVVIDTTESYRKYLSEMELKEQAFHEWLRKNYPDESPGKYQMGDGMLMKRGKEYYESKNKK
jgi:hypothetical protein